MIFILGKQHRAGFGIDHIGLFGLGDERCCLRLRLRRTVTEKRKCERCRDREKRTMNGLVHETAQLSLPQPAARDENASQP